MCLWNRWASRSNGWIVFNKRVSKSFEPLDVFIERLGKSFEWMDAFTKRVSKSFERLDVSIERVIKPFERMQIFLERMTQVVWTNANFFQMGSKRNSIRKRKAIIARFRVKGQKLM